MKNSDIYSWIGKISIFIIALAIVVAFSNWVSTLRGFVFDPILYLLLVIICYFLYSINQKLIGKKGVDFEEMLEEANERLSESQPIPKQKLLLTSSEEEVLNVSKPKKKRKVVK